MSFVVALSNKIRVKGKLKYVVILLFAFSLLFLTYQLIYYTNLNNYQSEESFRLLSISLKSDRSHHHQNSKGEPGGYRSLKDIARDLSLDKRKYHFGGHQQQQQKASKGVDVDEAPFVAPSVAIAVNKSGVIPNRRGKPVFNEHILGAAPEAQKFYMKQNQKNKDFFSCFTSGKLISWDKVNDDFCDCPVRCRLISYFD
jgi:hypothetical protein